MSKITSLRNFVSLAASLAFLLGFSTFKSATAQQSNDSIKLLSLNGPLDFGIQQSDSQQNSLRPSIPSWSQAAGEQTVQDPFMAAPGAPRFDSDQTLPAPTITQTQPNLSPYANPNSTRKSLPPASITPRLNPPQLNPSASLAPDREFSAMPQQNRLYEDAYDRGPLGPDYSQNYSREYSREYSRRYPRAVCPLDSPCPFEARNYLERQRLQYRPIGYVPYGGYVDNRGPDCMDGYCPLGSAPDRYDYEMQQALYRLRESMRPSYRVPYTGGYYSTHGFSFRNSILRNPSHYPDKP